MPAKFQVTFTGVEDAANKLRDLATKLERARRNVVMGYAMPCSIYVHERLDLSHPKGGQAKFLSTAMLQYGKMAWAMAASVYKTTGNLTQALLTAGGLIITKSNLLAPIDTGAMVASSYVATKQMAPVQRAKALAVGTAVRAGEQSTKRLQQAIQAPRFRKQGRLVTHKIAAKVPRTMHSPKR